MAPVTDDKKKSDSKDKKAKESVKDSSKDKRKEKDPAKPKKEKDSTSKDKKDKKEKDASKDKKPKDDKSSSKKARFSAESQYPYVILVSAYTHPFPSCIVFSGLNGLFLSGGAMPPSRRVHPS